MINGQDRGWGDQPVVSARLLPNALDKFAVFLADFLGLGERPPTFNLQTPEVCLYIANVGLEVPPNKISILFRCLRIGLARTVVLGHNRYQLAPYSP